MIQYCCLHLSPILCTKRNETRKRTQLKIKRSALITKAAPRDILDSCMRRRFQRAFRQAQRRVGKEKGHTYPVFSPESFLQIITIYGGPHTFSAQRYLLAFLGKNACTRCGGTTETVCLEVTRNLACRMHSLCIVLQMRK